MNDTGQGPGLRTRQSIDTFTILFSRPQPENRAADAFKVSILERRPHLSFLITKKVRKVVWRVVRVSQDWAFGSVRGPDG
jgi:hypothetical protein